jgi:hypothetical protein
MATTTFLGPGTLTLPDGATVEVGEEVELDEATQAQLEQAGLRFSSSATATAPQSAAENLAEEGTTAEAQAEASGLSVDAPKTPKK